MKLRMALFMIMFLILAACSSSSNEQAPTTTKAHEPGWILKHGQKALADLVECQVCHGANFEGNPPVPSCRECHIGGPPFFIHPPLRDPDLPWKYPSNHGSYAKENIKSCQGCHAGLGGGAGSNPRFIRALGNLESGCESATGCHNNSDPLNTFANGHNPRTAHPSFDPADTSKQDRKHWYGENFVYRPTPTGSLKYYPLNHATAGNMTAACSLCHGANLKGPAEGGVGPACMDCHVLDPIANPSRCVSCHGPLPGQQQSAPVTPFQLAQMAGRTDLQGKSTFQTFVSELTNRMKLDPSYTRINPADTQSPFYFGPSAFINFSTVTNLSSRSSHLYHDTLPCTDRQNNTTCSGCHTVNGNSASNMTRHHSLMFSRGLLCTSCHKFNSIDGGFSLGNITNCRDCHKENFSNCTTN